MVSKTQDGWFRFRVYLPHASHVELLGGFTRWRAAPIQMKRQEPGWWEVVAQIPEGEHEFCYLVDYSVWLADYAAHGVSMSGLGGWVSKMVVRPGIAQVAA